MDAFGSGKRSYGVDRRMEIVSGKISNAGGGNQIQIYATRFPDAPAVAARRASEKPWGFGDAQMKRKKRIAKYKVYTVEGKVKESLRKGIRWIKDKCSQIVHGY